MHDQNWYEVEARQAVINLVRMIAHEIARDGFTGAPMPTTDDCAEMRYWWMSYNAAQARALEAAMGELRPIEPALAAAIAAAYAAARRVV